MAYTFKETASGTVEVFDNGTRITTTTPQNAKLSYGYGGSATNQTALQQVQQSGGTSLGAVNQTPQAQMPAPVAPISAPTGILPTVPNKTGTSTNPTNPTTPAVGTSIYQAPAQSQQPQFSTPNLGAFQTPQAQQIQFAPVQSTGSSLVDFANALDEVVSKGRQARNAGSLQLMQGGQGVVKASDFNSILSNLNAASASTASDLTKRALEASQKTYQIQTIGNTQYQYAFDANGQFAGAVPIATLPENYSYNTMTLPNGDIYSIQYDSSGKPIGQQLMYQSPNTQGNTYDYVTDDKTGTIYEKTFDQSGQLQNMKVIGQLPQGESAQDLNDLVYKTSFQQPDGTIVFAGVNADGTKVSIPLGSERLPANATGGSEGTGGAKVSGSLVYGEADIQSGNATLEASKGPDGWVDPSVYLQMFQAWLDDGGKETDFLKAFPYAKWVNPENTWLRDSMTVAVQNKSKSSQTDQKLDSYIDSWMQSQSIQ